MNRIIRSKDKAKLEILNGIPKNVAQTGPSVPFVMAVLCSQGSGQKEPTGYHAEPQAEKRATV